MNAIRKNIKRKPTKADKEFAEKLNSVLSVAIPSAIAIEETVLGAALQDYTAVTILTGLKSQVFYKQAHKEVFLAIKELSKIPGAKVDLLTVAEMLKKQNKLESVGGPHFLVELTNKVSSSANLEYHIHILIEYEAKRRILRVAQKAISQVNNNIEDVFDIAETMRTASIINPPNGALKVRQMSQLMSSARHLPRLNMLAGELFRETEIAILFSPPGVGKSLLAVQIADALARGEDVIKDVLTNESEPKRTMYVDLELRDQEIYARYAEGADEWAFHPNLYHMGENDAFVGIAGPEELMRQIENSIIENKIEVLIIDNLTALAMDNLSDITVAQPIVSNLKRLQKTHGISILLVAHSNKIYNKTTPLQLSTMQGAAIISQLTQNIFTIGTSSNDEGINYIKQLKGRSGKVFDESHIIVLEKTRICGTFLGYKFIKYGTENDYLGDIEDENIADELYEQISSALAKGDPWSYVHDYFSYPKSLNTMKSRVRAFAKSSTSWTMGTDGKPRRLTNQIASFQEPSPEDTAPF